MLLIGYKCMKTSLFLRSKPHREDVIQASFDYIKVGDFVLVRESATEICSLDHVITTVNFDQTEFSFAVSYKSLGLRQKNSIY